MATLLNICQTALREIGDFNVPSSIINNTDPTAVQLLALADRTGKRLAKGYSWEILQAEHTFNTAASTEGYSLPTDYLKFANITFWDEANDEQIVGPVSAKTWQILQSAGIVGAGILKYFMIRGGQFLIYPVPTAIEAIAYQYYSNQWISSKSAFSDDTDAPLIDNDIFTLELKWRFLQAKGEDYEAEKQEAREELAIARHNDGGKKIIRFGPAVRVNDSIPETAFANYGA